MSSYTTVGGQAIKNVRVGYKKYGTLNGARDNVILICHYYSGNAHAAGKCKASDVAPQEDRSTLREKRQFTRRCLGRVGCGAKWGTAHNPKVAPGSPHVTPHPETSLHLSPAPRRQAAGETPMRRLNARLKASSDS